MKKMAVALGMLMVFLYSQLCFGASIDPAKINVPKDSGRIVDVYKSDNPNAPLIVYLQDIHINYEAQKAEAATIEALMRDYGFDLVLLEGKERDVTTDLKEFRDRNKEARQKTADELLKSGTILGVETLDLTTDYNFTIQGIEDMALYKQEAQDHAEIFSKEADISKLTEALKNIAFNLKLHIYTKEMRDLDDKITAYNTDEIGLVEYVKFLEGAAAANNVDVKALPNVALFIESANMEGKIDFTAVEKERTAATDAITKALADQKAKDDLAAKGIQFRTGDISQGQFYSYLADTAKAANVDISANKNLTAYTQYITTYEKIDTNTLFKEIDQLVEKLKAAMIKTPEQTRLAQIDKGLAVLSDMINTKLVPDEFNYFQQNKADFDLDGWLSFLKENSTKFGLTNPVPDNVNLLKTNMPLLEKFYSISFERDKAFMDSIKSSLAKFSKDKAILIAGGFHTPNMKKLLRENGYSYLIVAPKVDIIKDYSNIYKERAKKDLESLNNTVSATLATSEKK